MQIRRKGMTIFVPKGYWTTNYMRSSRDERNGNKRTKKTKHRA